MKQTLLLLVCLYKFICTSLLQSAHLLAWQVCRWTGYYSCTNNTNFRQTKLKTAPLTGVEQIEGIFFFFDRQTDRKNSNIWLICLVCFDMPFHEKVSLLHTLTGRWTQRARIRNIKFLIWFNLFHLSQYSMREKPRKKHKQPFKVESKVTMQILAVEIVSVSRIKIESVTMTC